MMKKWIGIMLFCCLPLLSPAQDNPKGGLHVDVYYFHVTNRCHTCLSIEEYVRATLDTYFKSQMEDDKLSLHVLNCELPENKTIAEKYLAYGSTLAITRVQNGKESTEDITGWAFQKAGNKELFISELKAKIEWSLAANL
jgi:hypothetical protein